MPAPAVRILGFDLSLRATGYGRLSVAGSRVAGEGWGVVRAPAAWPHTRCLGRLRGEFAALLREGDPPAAVAIEGIFHCRNVRTALTLGEVRGVLLAACAEAGVPVFEYAPGEVKRSVTGRGGASKEQVARMVVSLLGLSETPPEDAADALAVALCHERHRTLLRLGARKPL